MQDCRVTVLEFWPDYGPGPLWTGDGKPVELASLHLSDGLVARLAAWHARYVEDCVPVGGAGDPVWLAEGVSLLSDLRAELGSKYSVVVTEPWWHEDPT